MRGELRRARPGGSSGRARTAGCRRRAPTAGRGRSRSRSPTGDLAGGAERATLPVKAARSPQSPLRLLGPKAQARGAGTCGSWLGPRGPVRSPVLSAPASTPSSLPFPGLPVSLPPPHLSVSFLLFPVLVLFFLFLFLSFLPFPLKSPLPTKRAHAHCQKHRVNPG